MIGDRRRGSASRGSVCTTLAVPLCTRVPVSATVAGPHVCRTVYRPLLLDTSPARVRVRVRVTTPRQITSYAQFTQRLQTHLFRAQKSRSIVTLRIPCAVQMLLLTYLVTHLHVSHRQEARHRVVIGPYQQQQLSNSKRRPSEPTRC